MKIAVVGATGMVGKKMIEVLLEYKIKFDDLFLFASKKSAGKRVKIGKKIFKVLELNKENILSNKCDYALFSAGGERSLEFAPIFAKNGCTVIDNSSAWRQNPKCPLVVPEVNADDLITKNKTNIIANPNCSTIAVIPALKALDDAFKIKRIIYSTYQAVSGAGIEGYDDLKNGIKGKKPKKFPHQIFDNLIPQIDEFLPNGNTKEEEKMIFETRKILHNNNLKISATAVRVPIFNSHSISCNVEFKTDINLQQVFDVLNNAPGVVVLDDPKNKIYPMPQISNGSDQTFVGRIRLDSSQKNTINFFVCADNIRKGAASNAVQILQKLLEMKNDKTSNKTKGAKRWIKQFSKALAQH